MTSEQINRTIIDGLKHAREQGLTKDADIAWCIKTRIGINGLRIVAKPGYGPKRK